MNFAQKDGIIMLIGKKFSILSPYFEDPIQQLLKYLKLKIYLVNSNIGHYLILKKK